MRLIIDIPKSIYDKICLKMMHTEIDNPNLYFESLISNGTPIPYNAEPPEEWSNRDFNIECQNHNAMLHRAQENVIEKFKSCADMFSDEELKGAETVMNWIQEAEQEPCDDAVSREAVNTLVDELARAISDERCHIPQRGRSTATIMQDILDLPSVNPQPCDDAVSRQAVYEILEGNWNTDFLRAEVENLPSVRPQEQTGHWKSTIDGKPICSECGFVSESEDGYFVSHYCPYCGCRMVEPKETETWHGIHAQITAPKGTFERIFNEADDDYDI